MRSIADSSVIIQTSSQSVPETCWFGEMTLIAHYLRHHGVLALIEERVRGYRAVASVTMTLSTLWLCC